MPTPNPGTLTDEINNGSFQEFASAFMSSNAEVLKNYPVTTATATRALMHGAVNSILPLVLFSFLAEAYPKTFEKLHTDLKNVIPYAQLINMTLAVMITFAEYHGRKWTDNLLAGPNFRKDAVIGLVTLMFTQLFSGSQYGQQTNFGDFWNKLAGVNPLFVAFLVFFAVPGVLKSAYALGDRAIRGPKVVASAAEEEASVPPTPVVSVAGSRHSSFAAVPSNDETAALLARHEDNGVQLPSPAGSTH